MTQKSRAAILTEIGSLLADNTSQDITPSDVRSVVQDINDSFMLNTSLTRAALQALMSGVTVEVNSMYTVTNAVGATKVIVVFGKTTSTISTLAMNLTDNTFGVYDIAADTYYASSVNFKKSLSAANIKAAGNFDITELPALAAGYAWEIISCSARLVGATTPYNGNPVVRVGPVTASRQYNDSVILTNGADSFIFLERMTANDNLVESDKMVVEIVTSSLSGDGTLTIYGTARLITL